MTFTVDTVAQTIEISGVRMSLELLRVFTRTSPKGVWFRMERKGDEVTVHEKRDTEERHGR